jgi:hypothetical protein
MEGFLALQWHGAHDGGSGRHRDSYVIVDVVLTAAQGSTICTSVRRGAFVPFSMRASTNSKRELHDALKGGGHGRSGRGDR